MIEQQIRERDAESYLEAYIEGDSSHYQLEATAASSALTILVRGLVERDDLRRQLAEATEAEGYFTLNADRNLDPETKSALSELARAVYMNHLEADNADLRRQLAECQGKIKCDEIAFGKCAAEIEATHRQLAECQAKLVKSVPLSIYKLAVRSADAEDAILLRILPDLITEAKETPPVEGDWQQRLSDL